MRNRHTGCGPAKLNDVLDAELLFCSLIAVQAFAVGLPKLGNLRIDTSVMEEQMQAELMLCPLSPAGVPIFRLIYKIHETNAFVSWTEVGNL